MNQQALDVSLYTRRTRKMERLELMEGVVSWREFVSRLTAVAPPKFTAGRPPFAHETMLRLYLLQHLFGLSHFAIEEALFDTPLYRTFTGLGNTDHLPNRVSILRFGKTPSPSHLMEEYDLAKQFFETVNDAPRAKGLRLQSGTVVDAILK